MQTVGELMTTEIRTLSPNDTLMDAARVMRDYNVGNVLVAQGQTIQGILTDRDITVRALAEGMDPNTTRVSEICSTDLTTLTPEDTVDDAIALMRNRAVRRIPVVEGTRPVGMISIGDLALDRDRSSALADISAAKANA